MFLNAPSAVTQLERGDWLGVVAVAVVAIVALWRAYTKALASSKQNMEALDRNTIAFQHFGEQLKTLSTSIEKASVASERMQTAVLEEFRKRMRK